MRLFDLIHKNIRTQRALSLVAFVILLMVGSGFVAKYAHTNIATKTRQVHRAKRDTLEWFAEVAISKGSKEIIIPAPDVEIVTEINSIEEAFKAYTVVTAEPIEKKTVADGDQNILTWYRLKILENLSKKDTHSCLGCRYPDKIPLEMADAASDEILIAFDGGTIDVHGVKITMKGDRSPELTLHQPYLFFLDVDSPGQFASVAVGPAGIFKIDPTGKLTSLTNEYHKLKSQMNLHYRDEDGNISIAKFKTHINEYSKKDSKSN